MESLPKAASSIKNWAGDDQPRQKLRMKGPSALSDSELLAILINTGSKKRSAIELARDILALRKNDLEELGKVGSRDLEKVNGIGEAKAFTILAALELGRRRQLPKSGHTKTMISNSREISDYLRIKLKDLCHEVFVVVYLNRANKIIDQEEVISIGGITGTVADPRIILKKALELNAVSIILCHNHPSGNLKPSRADMDLTNKIREAANFLDIKVLDHIIVSDEGYYSFADEGIL